MQIIESTVHRILISILFLLLFALYLDNMSLHERFKQCEQEKQDTDQQIKDLEHEVTVYKALCDSIIYGRQEGW